MTHAAILGPTTLLGREVRETLARRRRHFDRLSLFAGSAEEEGTVTAVSDTAAIVAAATPEALADVDLIFACGELAHDLPLVRQRVAAGGATALLLSPEARAEHGVPVVAGLGPAEPPAGEVLVSPHPAALALAYLLAPHAGPSAGFAAESAAATLVQPASLLGTRALEDLLDQARDLITMSGGRRPTVFDRQLAFSLYPAPEGSGGIAELARRASGVELPLAVQTLQGGIFHGLSCSLFIRFASDPGVKPLRKALAAQKHVRVSPLSIAADEVPAPIDAAAKEEVLVGSVRPDPNHPNGYWIWAVVDNLIRGGALNAIDVAERILAVG